MPLLDLLTNLTLDFQLILILSNLTTAVVTFTICAHLEDMRKGE